MYYYDLNPSECSFWDKGKKQSAAPGEAGLSSDVTLVKYQILIYCSVINKYQQMCDQFFFVF